MIRYSEPFLRKTRETVALLKAKRERDLNMHEDEQSIDPEAVEVETLFSEPEIESPFDFGVALQLLKDGEHVAREGWNGKKMFVYLNMGSIAADYKQIDAENTATLLEVGGVSVELFGKGDAGTITRMPNINMRAADGSIVTGWLASQTDMLAQDWVRVDY